MLEVIKFTSGLIGLHMLFRPCLCTFCPAIGCNEMCIFWLGVELGLSSNVDNIVCVDGHCILACLERRRYSKFLNIQPEIQYHSLKWNKY
jgi:hypothetical protein